MNGKNRKFSAGTTPKKSERSRAMLGLPLRSSRLLPPIGEEPVGRSAPPTPTKGSPRHKPWSRFHSECHHNNNSIYLDWASLKTDKKTPEKTPKIDKTRAVLRTKDVLPKFEKTKSASCTQVEVTEYLQNNEAFLERYVCERIPVATIEKWLTKKTGQKQVPSLSPVMDANQEEEHNPQQRDFKNLFQILKEDTTEHLLLWELANYMSSSVGVDAYRVYKLYPDHPNFVQYFLSDNMVPQDENRGLIRAEPKDVALVLEVARTGACRRLSRADDPSIFPKTPVTLFRALKMNVTRVDHVMYQPILTKCAKTAYVIEMWRIDEKFEEVSEILSAHFMVMGSLSLQYCNMYLDKKREGNMSDFLLDVVRDIFEEIVSLDQLIMIILEFAQRLVNADRASLFLVDYRNCELVSTVFDLKYEPGSTSDIEKKEIRMPINRGIAGHVAMTGETMNIPDAYSDHRFNRQIDEATGYKTVSILCMPIKAEGSVIAVVQMVNKRDEDCFCQEDEVSFGVFSTFFGLALHHARLYDRIIRNEQKYRVALEVLSYHNTCKETDVMAMLGDTVNTLNVNLNTFYLDPFNVDEMNKCKGVIEMFSDLFDLSNFDMSTLTRFVLTVKKNYRNVPYHNFDHGWAVAQTMYVILKNDYRKRFDYNMRLALFVASLCHDLDHRGYTNKYMSESASPLAAMYTTSTLEHHHFNITVTILQQDGHNIFSHFSSEDYKEILGNIRHCILATDLANFFPNLEKLNELCPSETPKFNWSLKRHRDLAMALCMTGADLSASAKPWHIQLKTVNVIFEEFYDQGDMERAAGREPIPMMERNKPDEQPASQVGFLSQICIPCYSMLNKLLPGTRSMYLMALNNLEMWKAKETMIEQKREKSNEAQSVNPQEGDENNDEGIKYDEGDEKNGKASVIVASEVTKESVILYDVVNEETVAEEEEEIVEEVVTPKSAIWKNIYGMTLRRVVKRKRAESTDSEATSEQSHNALPSSDDYSDKSKQQ